MSEQESDIQINVEDIDHSKHETQTEGTEETEENVRELQAKLAESEAKAKENWDLLLRSKAELDNVQKRAQRDLENAHKYAIERLAQEILSAIDSMELGLSAAMGDDVSIESIIEGNELTHKMLTQGLEKYGVTPINPLNERFNPDQQQAMSMQETAEYEAGTVISVMQKGYLLKDRLLRPALVVIAKAPSETSKAEAEADSGASK